MTAPIVVEAVVRVLGGGAPAGVTTLGQLGPAAELLDALGPHPAVVHRRPVPL